MLRVGDKAPPIDAMTSLGTRFVLAEQQGLCTIVYFFPKAFTPGCTRETKYFRDNHMELMLAGASIVGVSTDKHETQCEFASSMNAPFPMIADTDLSISRSYDVLWPIVGLARRVTYVVSPAGVIEAVFHYEFDVEEHRNDVLRFVHQKFRAGQVGSRA
ncbi:MAG: peroxiredoxin [Polyangiaceae bacterium]|nr:peroxiredoxin [Polyangiaceae bacterium]